MPNEAYKIVLEIDGKNSADATLKSTNEQLDKMETSVKKTTSSWSGFKDGVSTALGAFAIAGGFAAVVGQINEIGSAARGAEITFNQVSGGADLASASLARMRELTGGVIDDMSLMKGASSLLVTGIAQTSEQAEELVNLGARLGAVMGVDAAESIDNLNSALLNNSFMRLDTLGISAARVRERVNELKEAGLDMSAAFSQAVLEIGSQTLDDLGAAAGVAENAMARLAIRAQNLGQDLAQLVTGGLEQAAISLEQLIILGDIAFGGTGGQAPLIAEAEAARQAAAAYEELSAMTYQLIVMRQGMYSGGVTEILSQETAMAYAQANPQALQTIGTGSFFRDAFSGDSLAGRKNATTARQSLEDITGQSFAGYEDAQLLQFAADLDTTFSSIADAQTALRIETEQATQAQVAQTRSFAIQDGVMALYNRTLNEILYSLDDISSMSGEFSATISGGTIETGGMNFFAPSQLSEAQAQAEAIVDEYERLKAIGESSEFTLVSEEDVERARLIAESATETAEQAERNARAWESASLAQIAGATSGGRANEFNQGVLAQLSPEQAAQAEHMLNLQSGVETANTMVVEYAQALNAAIFSEFGTAAGVRAAERIQVALEEGIMQGLEGTALQRYVEQQVGFAISGGTGGMQEVQVQAGEGYISLSQRTGIDRQTLEAATGGGMLLAGQIIQVGDGTTLVAVNGTPEELLTSTLTSAAENVMGNIASASLNPQSAYGMGSAPAAFTYYDPSTYSYDTSNQMAAPSTGGGMFDSQDSEVVAAISGDMLVIETSIMNISQTDVSPVIDPLIEDAIMADDEVADVTKSLQKLAATDLSIEMPIRFIFENVAAEILARNPSVIELFTLVLPQFGVSRE